VLLNQFNGTILTPSGDITIFHDKKTVLIWRASMNFVIHFNFAGFVEDLPPGSIVYVSSFTIRQLEVTQIFTMLTTEASVSGGTIHVVRLAIEATEEDTNKNSGIAGEKFKELLEIRGMVWRQGMVLTEGLNDAVQVYSNTGVKYSVERIDEMIAEAKEGSKE
jgi:hypothetical protein